MERPLSRHLLLGQFQLPLQEDILPKELKRIKRCGAHEQTLPVRMQPKVRHVRTDQGNLACFRDVVVKRGPPVRRIRNQGVVLTFHVRRQEVDGSRAVKASQIQRQVALHRAKAFIQWVSLRRRGTRETQAVILHQPQGLNQVRNNPPGQQFPFEDQVFLFEIVQAVNDKGIHGVVEVVPVVGSSANPVCIVIHVRHFSAREDGVLGVPVAFPT